MADLPIPISDADLRERLTGVIDREGKVGRALAALGPLTGSRVVLLDADGSLRTDELSALGAQVTALPGTVTERLPTGLADAVVSFWGAFRGGTQETEAQVREAERIVRPGGRLLVVHDYGRDDVSRLLGDEDRERQLIEWSHRFGWFVAHDFKIRVLHCWWSFSSMEDARDVLGGIFGTRGLAVVAGMKRPRIEHKVAIYHRTLGMAEDGEHPARLAGDER